MDEARDACLAGSPCNRARTLDVEGVKRLGARARQDTDRIDHAVSARHRTGNRGWKAQVRLHGHDLADRAQRLQMAGKIRTPLGGPHAPAGFGQGPHGMAANEP